MIKKMICPHCHGDGQIEMPIELKQALFYVEKMKRATARGLHRICIKEGITRSAANARLKRLCQAGFISRQLDGREFVYMCEKMNNAKHTK
jgi:DNA-binding MarR family transcriptional regulator